MPPALLPLLLFAPPVGGSTPADAVTAPRPAATSRTVRQRQGDDFAIVDRDDPPSAVLPVTKVMLGTHVGLDRALIDERRPRSGGAAR